MFKISNFNIFIFDSFALIFALYMAFRETLLYQRTNKEFHKMYSLFFICASMIFMPFIILMITRWSLHSLRSISYDLVSAVFAIAALFYYFRAEKLRKQSQ